MLLGGDEIGRTQQGNNNAYCQDNEISWVSWGGLSGDRDFLRFVRGLVAFRLATATLRREKFLTDGDVTWFGPDGGEVEWSGGAFGYHLKPDVLVLANLTEAEVSFRLPEGLALRLVADTAAEPPGDFVEGGTRWKDATRAVAPKSLVLFRVG
jgi:glycogen operon protein